MKNSKIQITAFMLSVLMITCLSASAQNKQKNFVINGILKDSINNITKIYLVYNPVFKKALDSSSIVGGRYSFKGNIPAAFGATLSLTPVPSTMGRDRVDIVLDQGTLNITSTRDLVFAEYSGNGSKATIQFDSLFSIARAKLKDVMDIRARANFDSNDSIQKVWKSKALRIVPELLEDQKKFIRQHPSSSLSPYLLYYLLWSKSLTSSESVDSLTSGFSVNFKTSYVGKAIDNLYKTRKQFMLNKEILNGDNVIGSMAPELKEFDKNERSVKLSSLRGQYVLIDFWASWCAPCRAENPNLLAAFTKYKDRKFTILGVSLDKERTKWLKAVSDDHMPWLQVSSLQGFDAASAQAYAIDAIPMNFLIDPDGRIVAKNLRGKALEEKLVEIFN